MLNKDDIPLVSMDSMNETHFEELEIINSLLEQLKAQADFDSVSTSLELLLAHMKEHFYGEEKIMQEAQYPSFRMHQADHNKVLNEARYAEMEWRNKKDIEALREYVEENVIVWLDQHIKAMDTPMADFMTQSAKI